MEFVEFLKKVDTDNGAFIWYGDGVFSITHNKLHIYHDTDTPNISNLIPFVFDFPKDMFVARFGYTIESFIEYENEKTFRWEKQETIYEFLKRVSRWNC